MGSYMDNTEIPRQSRLRDWMRSQGLTNAALADEYGCHFTYPGKVLGGREEMPEKFREFMLARGCPPELLPERISRKTGENRNQKLYLRKKESARLARIEKIRQERINRPRSDISITAGV